ncbi:single-stranded DNA-binding protein [Escherichia coli]|uniref:single-stranded DNA-binding protein n=1 Tax=Escherichia coli TaxID=562 RepID=UPI0020230614|nr:single-stranded DNA-binding protein [Escherichia coli]
MFCPVPFTCLSPCLAAKVLKQVMVNTGGNKRQVPAKRQNRGSRNSTDDGG